MRRTRQRGHAMLELALSAGVMVACLGGTFQFGYTFYVYNRLVTAIGNGARYAATLPTTDSKLAIQNMVVFGDSLPTPQAIPVAPNLKPEQVRVEWIGDDPAHPQSVRVSLANYKVDALLSTFDFTGRPMAEFPYVPAGQP